MMEMESLADAEQNMPQAGDVRKEQEAAVLVLKQRDALLHFIPTLQALGPLNQQ